jgi:hypothetical protein
MEPVSAQLRRNDHSGGPNPVQYLFPNQITEKATIGDFGALVHALTTKTNIVQWPN